MAPQITENQQERGCFKPPEASRRLAVHVLFTDVSATLTALRTAAQLCCGLDAGIRLVFTETVPFPLPLDAPRRNLDFVRRQFRTIVTACGSTYDGRSVETTVEILLCRDAEEALLRRLEPGSLVVIGKRSRWWSFREDLWARMLRRAGHHVVCTSAPSSLMKGIARG